jgi:hypothetical protein
MIINARRLGYALLWITIATVLGHSQEAAANYVAPSEAIPKGSAPKMQVQLLTTGGRTQQYAVIFYQGDEVFSGLLKFAKKYYVTGAHFIGVHSKNETGS